jgi:two-component system, LytTR family, response regulator
MTPRLRAVLVDDEVLARLALRQALASHAEVEIVGECGNADEAMQAVRALRPDLLFLDIQMPGMDGFELLHELAPDCLPLVVFATAFAEHALRAFDARAVDYVLKPIEQARFDQAMARVNQHWQGLHTPHAHPQPTVMTGADARFLHRDTLRHLLATLDPTRFLRIHRGIMVNLDRVAEVHPLFQGNAEVVLRDGTRLGLSRRFRAHARRALGMA